MELMSTAVAAKVPPLYGTEHLPLAEKTVHLKWFTPWSNWTWFVVEYDPADRLCWGLVVGHEAEWGYFSLDEIADLRGPGGLRVERDLHCAPCTVAELVRRERLDVSL